MIPTDSEVLQWYAGLSVLWAPSAIAAALVAGALLGSVVAIVRVALGRR